MQSYEKIMDLTNFIKFFLLMKILEKYQSVIKTFSFVAKCQIKSIGFE